MKSPYEHVREVQLIPYQKISLKKLVQELEICVIIQAMKRYRCCKAAAAEELGMNRTTLVEKCKKYGLMNMGKAPKSVPVKVYP